MVVEKVVLIPVTCEKCGEPHVVECRHSAGFGIMGFHTVECPHCHCVAIRRLPSDIYKSADACAEFDDSPL